MYPVLFRRRNKRILTWNFVQPILGAHVFTLIAGYRISNAENSLVLQNISSSSFTGHRKSTRIFYPFNPSNITTSTWANGKLKNSFPQSSQRITRPNPRRKMRLAGVWEKALRTYGRTDGWTNTSSYRDVTAHLKMWGFNLMAISLGVTLKIEIKMRWILTPIRLGVISTLRWSAFWCR